MITKLIAALFGVLDKIAEYINRKRLIALGKAEKEAENAEHVSRMLDKAADIDSRTITNVVYDDRLHKNKP